MGGSADALRRAFAGTGADEDLFGEPIDRVPRGRDFEALPFGHEMGGKLPALASEPPLPEASEQAAEAGAVALGSSALGDLAALVTPAAESTAAARPDLPDLTAGFTVVVGQTKSSVPADSLLPSLEPAPAPTPGPAAPTGSALLPTLAPDAPTSAEIVPTPPGEVTPR